MKTQKRGIETMDNSAQHKPLTAQGILARARAEQIKKEKQEKREALQKRAESYRRAVFTLFEKHNGGKDSRQDEYSQDIKDWIKTGKTENRRLRRFIHEIREALRPDDSKPDSMIARYKSCSRPAHFERLFKKTGGEWLGKWLGVEIEHTRPDTDKQHENNIPGWLSYHDDGSVHAEDDGYISREVTILLKQDQQDRIDKICKTLNAIDARVNRSCGLHIHIDVRDKTPAQRNTIYRHYVAALPWLVLMLAPSRLTNTYCRDNRTDHSRGRYKMINRASISEHRTIEIRAHQGTTDAAKIRAWIKLFLELKSQRRIVDTLEAALTTKLLTPETQAYIESRVVNFHPEMQETINNMRIAAQTKKLL